MYKTAYGKSSELADKIVEAAVKPYEKVKISEDNSGISQGLMSSTRKAFQEARQEFSGESLAPSRQPPEDMNAEYIAALRQSSPKPKLRPKSMEAGFQLMEDLQEALGLTKEQAAGIVGNLHHETGGFEFMDEIDPIVPGSKGGTGYAMWTAGRRKDFENWAEAQGLDTRDHEANFGYLVHEIQNTKEFRNYNKFEAATTAEEAARLVSDNYLRPGIPHLDKRLALANWYMTHSK